MPVLGGHGEDDMPGKSYLKWGLPFAIGEERQSSNVSCGKLFDCEGRRIFPPADRSLPRVLPSILLAIAVLGSPPKRPKPTLSASRLSPELSTSISTSPESISLDVSLKLTLGVDAGDGSLESRDKRERKVCARASREGRGSERKKEFMLRLRFRGLEE